MAIVNETIQMKKDKRALKLAKRFFQRSLSASAQIFKCIPHMHNNHYSVHEPRLKENE